MSVSCLEQLNTRLAVAEKRQNVYWLDGWVGGCRREGREE